MPHYARTITIYLTLACGCSYPELWAITQALITLNPKRWLIKAAKKGDLEMISYYAITQYANSKNSEYPLSNNWNMCVSEAARGGHKHIVQYLAAQLNPNVVDWNLCMVCAARRGHLSIVQYAVERGANDWQMCISEAAYGGHIKIIAYYANILNVNSEDPGTTGSIDWNWCLFQAARKGHLPLVRYVVKCGGPNIVNWSTCMTFAAIEGHQKFDQERIHILGFLEQCKFQYSKK